MKWMKTICFISEHLSIVEIVLVPLVDPIAQGHQAVAEVDILDDSVRIAARDVVMTEVPVIADTQ